MSKMRTISFTLSYKTSNKNNIKNITLECLVEMSIRFSLYCEQSLSFALKSGKRTRNVERHRLAGSGGREIPRSLFSRSFHRFWSERETARSLGFRLSISNCWTNFFLLVLFLARTWSNYTSNIYSYFFYREQFDEGDYLRVGRLIGRKFCQ